MSTDRVQLVEVGPRDGLQNEARVLSTAEKVRFIVALAQAGHSQIEATAFVSPRAVPQLADASEVLAAVPRRKGLVYSALVPNAIGLERALAAGVDEIAVFTAVSDAFSLANVNATVEQTFERFAEVFAGARDAGLPIRGYISTVLHCPYEGVIDPARAVPLVLRLLDLGCREVSLGETTGQGSPEGVRELCSLLGREGVLDRCAGHFHDTFGMAVANTLVAFDAGVRTFDASAGGLGGCPYAPGAAGNAATEDLVWLFMGLGVATGIDLEAQVRAAAIVEEALGARLPGRTYRALREA